MSVVDQQCYPLSSNQRGVWFDQMLHPEAPLYNMGGYLRIEGPVDPDAFQGALDILVARNDALRILLCQGADLPMQTIAPQVQVSMPVLDFSDRPDPERDLFAWMATELDRPFELYDAPLFGFALLKASDRRFYWFHRYHHLIVDAYAHSLLVQQLAPIYTAVARGEAPPATPPFSYLHYVRDDDEYVNSEKFAQSCAYWAERFQEPPAPFVERRGFGDSIEHRRSVMVLDRPFYNRLIALGASQGASTFHVILAALYSYFVRAANREEFVIGVPTLNRSTAHFKRTVGLFTAITPAWFRLGTALSSATLVKAIGAELRKDYRHQRVPLTEINRLAGLHKEGRVQLFDIVLTYQRQSYDVTLDGYAVEQVSLRHGGEQTPLALEVSEYNDELDVRVNIDYSLTAFGDGDIERLQDRLRSVLEQMVDQPDAPIDDLEIMPERERRLVLQGFNEGAPVVAPWRTIVEALEGQVTKRPDAVAVTDRSRRLTYGELNSRANQLAHHLRGIGVQVGDKVGICMERSADLVVGIVAILKAGGAYVPLDPSYPADRLAFMLRDSAARVLLTDGRARSLTTPDVATVLVNADADAIAQQPATNPSVSLSPDQPAYVIYTSGSTGAPKGTLVSHHNVVRLFAATDALYRFGSEDVWTLFHSVAFDFSVWELFGPLFYGGRLVIVPYWVSRSPDEFYRLLVDERVTVLNQTPSAFAQLMRVEESIAPAGDLQLRFVIFGGEALNLRTLRPWFDRHGAERPTLVNMYGITETTVHVTHRPLQPSDLDHGRSVIGRPIPDLRVYILDRRLRPAPIGVPGEIFVSGAGVSLGYLNRPELTNERFLSDPFAGADARMYRSGDIARWLPNGDIEYCGRADDQMKIRGFRIELGEVEAVLRRHPQVNDCVVVGRQEEGMTCDLVAYVVPADGEAGSARTLRAFVADRLPEHMVPAAFVSIGAVPLTPSGKVDKRSLPPPDGGRFAREEALVPPQTRAHALVAEVWRDVLQVEDVGIHDNFFELGGHSLLMFRVRARLARLFGRTPSMAEMFQSPTIDALARRLDSRDHEEPLLPAEDRAALRTSRHPSQARRRDLRIERRAGASRADVLNAD